MSWLDNLRTRGGPLLQPAERWLRSEADSGDASFGGGREGLLMLARRLEAWAEREDVDPSQEARFIEGAGALLGLLLIDHVERARHAARDGEHRVQLGEHGFFDPFRAVEAALDAADVRRELAREVARAEAEAIGKGPLSRVVDALHRVLTERRPDLRITTQFETRVQLSDGSEIDLARTVRATVGEPEAQVVSTVRRLVDLVPQGDRVRAASWQEVAPLVVPRLGRAQTLAELSARGRGSLWSRPWLGPLHAAIAIRHEDRARYVRVDEVESWQAEGARPWTRALSNLAATSKGARWARIDTAMGPLVISRSGDGLDSARALLPGLFEVLSVELGPQVRFGIPHRDMLLACPAEPASLVERLSTRVAQDFERAPHKLCPLVFRLDAQGPTLP